MREDIYIRVSGIIFTLVALLHALRLGGKWDVVIGAWSVPAWTSMLAVLISGYLAFTAFRLLASKRTNGV